jgi:peptidoglycan/xylan/chitin deacetylase (PgdA/CDA1 family)
MIVLITVIIILLTPFYLVYKPPNWLIRYFQHRWPDVLWEVSTTEKIVALTLDDAPSEWTNEILEVLKANNATATFFVIGSQIQGREHILEDLVRNGNELANHAMHDEPSRSLTDVVLAGEIGTVRASIHSAYAAANITTPPDYFRPGSGFFNERMRKNVANLGHKIVLGSIYPHDPGVCALSFQAIRSSPLLDKF